MHKSKFARDGLRWVHRLCTDLWTACKFALPLVARAGVCKYASRMADDLITTKAAAAYLGKAVATLNRWAADEREDRPQPALTLPGATGARLYRRADVEAHGAVQVALALKHGACPSCTAPHHIEFHNDDPCPTEAVAS